MPFRTPIPTLPIPDHRLPPALDGLNRLAYNMYWSWHPEVRSLFARIDRRVWLNYRSPVAVLRVQRDWTSLLDDPDFMVQYQTVLNAFDVYMENGREHWFTRHHGEEIEGPVAYFCAEYGLQESLPIYSGGLGVLAGDHCKAASDMALPFVAVGLFYRRGYFRQNIDADGHQEHGYFNLDPARLPLQRAVDPLGEPLTGQRGAAGRVPSTPRCGWCRWVACRCCCSTPTCPRTPRATGPSATSSTCAAARCACTRSSSWAWAASAPCASWASPPRPGTSTRATPRSCSWSRRESWWPRAPPSRRPSRRSAAKAVFTIHTPVPAGNERFAADLVRELTAPEAKASGIDIEQILQMGLGVDGDTSLFDMTAFALRNTSLANGVSQLHGRVADATWSPIIDHHIRGITNGVHPPTWVGRPMRKVLAGARRLTSITRSVSVRRIASGSA